MSPVKRRSLLHLALAVIPPSLLARATRAESPFHGQRVAAGSDREAKARAIGLSHTSYKVLTAETGGALFVFEQANHRKGGPGRHLHHNEDELSTPWRASTSSKSAASRAWPHKPAMHIQVRP